LGQVVGEFDRSHVGMGNSIHWGKYGAAPAVGLIVG